LADAADKAITDARALDCRKINCLADMLPAGVKPDVADATRIGNVRYAAERLADAGIALAFEHDVFSKIALSVKYPIEKYSF
jgi:hydroxypyruvate isomerase